jgi:hypothetical protein
MCDKEKNLIKAHLLPEAFFRFLYPEERVDNQNSLIMVSGDKNYTKRRPIGIYDESILCGECDEFLGKLDDLGKKVFLDTEPQLVAKTPNGDGWKFMSIDQAKLKLFLLSILWRFSISKMEETKNVKLPNKFEGRLKNMIKDLDPGNIDEFSTVITRYKFRNPDIYLHKFFHEPTPCRMENVRFWGLCIPNGYKVLIKTDSRNQLKSLRGATINCAKEDTLIIDAGFFEDSKQFQAAIQNAHKVK